MPVLSQRSIKDVKSVAACAGVSLVVLSREATLSGDAGGVGVKVGSIPAPTVVANVVNAASKADAADGDSNADCRDATRAEAAAATVVEGGTMAEA
jgi:hypothetical protein